MAYIDKVIESFRRAIDSQTTLLFGGLQLTELCDEIEALMVAHNNWEADARMHRKALLIRHDEAIKAREECDALREEVRRAKKALSWLYCVVNDISPTNAPEKPTNHEHLMADEMASNVLLGRADPVPPDTQDATREPGGLTPLSAPDKAQGED